MQKIFLNEHRDFLNIVPIGKGIKWTEYRDKKIPQDFYEESLKRRLNWGVIAGGSDTWEDGTEKKRVLLIDIDWYQEGLLLSLFKNGRYSKEDIISMVTLGLHNTIHNIEFKDRLKAQNSLSFYYPIISKSGGLQYWFYMTDATVNGEMSVSYSGSKAKELDVYDEVGTKYTVPCEIKGSNGSLLNCPFNEDTTTKDTGMATGAYLLHEGYAKEIPTISLLKVSENLILDVKQEQIITQKTETQKASLRRTFMGAVNDFPAKDALIRTLDYIDTHDIIGFDKDCVRSAREYLQNINYTESNKGVCIFQKLFPHTHIKPGNTENETSAYITAKTGEYPNLYVCWGGHCRDWRNDGSENRTMNVYALIYSLLNFGEGVIGSKIEPLSNKETREYNFLVNQILFDGKEKINWHKDEKESVISKSIKTRYTEWWETLPDSKRISDTSMVLGIYNEFCASYPNHFFVSKTNEGKKMMVIYIYDQRLGTYKEVYDPTDLIFSDIIARVMRQKKDALLRAIQDNEYYFDTHSRKSQAETKVNTYSEKYNKMHVKQELFHNFCNLMEKMSEDTKNNIKILRTRDLNKKDEWWVVVDWDDAIIGVYNQITGQFYNKSEDDGEKIIQEKLIDHRSGNYAFIRKWWSGEYIAPEKRFKELSSKKGSVDLSNMVRFMNSLGGDMFFIWLAKAIMFKNKQAPMLIGATSTGKSALMLNILNAAFCVNDDNDTTYLTKQDERAIKDPHSLMSRYLSRGHIVIDEAEKTLRTGDIRTTLFSATGAPYITLNEKFKASIQLIPYGNVILLGNDAPGFISHLHSGGTKTRFNMSWIVGNRDHGLDLESLYVSSRLTILHRDKKYDGDYINDAIDFMTSLIERKKTNKQYKRPFGTMQEHVWDRMIDGMQKDSDATSYLISLLLTYARKIEQDISVWEEVEAYCETYNEYNQFIAQLKMHISNKQKYPVPVLFGDLKRIAEINDFISKKYPSEEDEEEDEEKDEVKPTEPITDTIPLPDEL